MHGAERKKEGVQETGSYKLPRQLPYPNRPWAAKAAILSAGGRAGILWKSTVDCWGKDKGGMVCLTKTLAHITQPLLPAILRTLTDVVVFAHEVYRSAELPIPNTHMLYRSLLQVACKGTLMDYIKSGQVWDFRALGFPGTKGLEISYIAFSNLGSMGAILSAQSTQANIFVLSYGKKIDSDCFEDHMSDSK